MRDVNFLPHEIKEKIFKRKRNLINYSIAFIVLINMGITLHILQGINEINLAKKRDIKVESQVFNNEKSDVLDFFKENIENHYLYDSVIVKEANLNLKIIIKDKYEFASCVEDLEKIKKCTIEYLVAPYEENSITKFEVGLKVKNEDEN